MRRFKKSIDRFFRFPAIRIIVGLAVVGLIPVVVNRFVLKPAFSLLIPGQGAANTLRYLAALLLYCGVYILFIRISEKRNIPELGLAGLGKNAGLGFALSLGAMGAIAGVCAIAGIYAIDGFNPGFEWIRVFAFVAVLAFNEELLFRGIFYRIAEKTYGTISALAASAVVFSVMHLVNPGASWASFLSAALGGTIAGLLFTWRGNLWLCATFHAGWNYFQAVLGSSVSGTDSFGFFFKGKLTGTDLLTGGTFGIEASIVTLVVLATFAAGLAGWMIKKKLYFTPRRRSPWS